MFLQPHANVQHHSSYGLAGMLFTSKSAHTDGRTDGQTDARQVITKSLSEQGSGETKITQYLKVFGMVSAISGYLAGLPS